MTRRRGIGAGREVVGQMQETFRLGRVAGLRIGVNWSVAVIFALIALGLAEGSLPEVQPGRAWPLYWGVGLVTAVVFFASLLAHEVAHALVARRNGVEVESVVLWLFGGVTRLGGEAGTPGAELRIAGSGPLVSLVLGAVFGGCAWLLGAVFGAGLAAEAAAWLSWINVLLAVFNSIPAAPLDGGRLLRAFLWWRTGDRVKAAVGAASAGRVLGWVLMFLGLYVLLLGGTLGGIWLALIGWFILAAATAEGRQTQLREVLAGVPVREAMTPDPVSVRPGYVIADLLEDPPFGYRYSTLPVTGEDGAAVGLMTLDRARGVSPAGRRSTTVRDVMLPLDRAVTAAPDDSLADLLPRMEGGAERRVLVLDGDRLVGLVSPLDVNRTVSWLMSRASRPGSPRLSG